MVQNKSLSYAAHPPPGCFPEAGVSLKLTASAIDLVPPPEGIVTKTHYVALDVWEADRMRPAEVESYVPAFDLNQPITNASIISVVASDSCNFTDGDLLIADWGDLSEYTIYTKKDLDERKVKPLKNPHGVPPRHFLGVLGLAGLTGYSSLYAIGQPKAGEVIFVSSAAGPVGQLVGQMAKADGLTVIGSVGSDEKVKFIIDELGFDAGFNYKTEDPLAALRRLAPEGIDIYYENVGGVQLEAAIYHIKEHGRIIVSGMLSQYGKPMNEQYGVRNLLLIAEKRVKMQGFLVIDEDMGPKYADEHSDRVANMIKDGTFKVREEITVGIENAETALLRLFNTGSNGKSLLEIYPL